MILLSYHTLPDVILALKYSHVKHHFMRSKATSGAKVFCISCKICVGVNNSHVKSWDYQFISDKRKKRPSVALMIFLLQRPSDFQRPPRRSYMAKVTDRTSILSDILSLF